MNNRREFLKWFGMGAAIAPVVSGVPIMEAESVITKPPGVEPVKFEAAQEMPTILPGGLSEMMVTFTDEKGTRHVFKASAMVLSMRTEPLPVRGLDGRLFLNTSVLNQRCKFVLEGEIVASRGKFFL